MDSSPGDVGENLRKGARFAEDAKDRGAELVVFPELFNVGYDFEIIKSMDYNFDGSKTYLSDLAKRLNIHIAAGILEEADGKRYNSLFVFDKEGAVIARYRKINLFPLAEEAQLLVPGEKGVTFSIGGFKFGLMICFDIRFPELGTFYSKEGCNILMVASAFPFPRLDHWRILLQSRAIENQMYLAASNRCGKDGDFWFCGNSSIIDPWGTVKAKAEETGEAVICHELVLDKVEQVRKFIPCIENKKRHAGIGVC